MNSESINPIFQAVDGKSGPAILIVEDEASHAEAIVRSLEASGWTNIEVVETLHDFRIRSIGSPPTIALVDLNLPDGRATELLNHPAEQGRFPIIIMTSYGDEKTVAEVMKCGAFDYLVKSQEVFLDLPRFLTRSLREWELQHERITLMNETKALYDLSIDMLCIADMNGYFRRLNPAFSHTLGYSADELLSKPYIDFVHPDDKVLTINTVNDLAKGKRIIGFANRYLTKTGEYRSLEWNASLSPQGDLIYAVARDVTGRIENEKEAQKLREQLSQSSKMESIGQLTAGIAHDFNNMLGAMIGYSELSQQMIAADKTNSISQYQDEILKAGGRAKELISQMLTFSHLNSETKKEEEVPVIALASVVTEVVSLLRSSIPKTIELNYHIETEDVKARILPVHLHQILLNLGVNARDALGEYGKIDISLSKRSYHPILCSSCKLDCGNECVQISVKDNGSGIPEDIINQIFDPFFTNKGVGKGTGMGLSVVHGLVHTMGGHIQVDTSVENGTAFNILLPLVDTDLTPELVTINTTPEVNIEGLRIMIVDDEPALSNMLLEYLSKQGAEVSAFTDPIQAMEIFAQQAENIDLVITDESMPEMSGMLLAENMLKLKPELPIILCTGYSEHANAESVTAIGIAGFLNKPISMNKLKLKIHDLINSQTQS